MRVCHVVASINRDIGGPAISVPRLASALAARGVESHLATLDYPEHGPQTQVPGATLTSLPTTTLNRLGRGWSPAFHHALTALARQGLDVLHNHGLWMFPNHYARQVAVTAGVPLVISPRGMVEQWSLGRSRWKKWLVWHAYEKANLAHAAMFHATSHEEAASIRALGLRQPIAMIPNGIEIPEASAFGDRALLERKFPELRGRRWLLFLSRLHPKKGILELLRVWQRLHAQFSDWHLVLAGPDLDGYTATIRAAVNDLRLTARVTLTGMLAGELKDAAWAGAELFVLPTYSENFGLSVAEALAHGCPALTTHGAPWRGLTEQSCGWWIEMAESELATALATALQTPAEERRAMGVRGRDWMRRDFSWAGIAERMEACYAHLLGQGPRPDCVLAV
jgi:glycosyltransferase involved in cell wall biosynthesis